MSSCYGIHAVDANSILVIIVQSATLSCNIVLHAHKARTHIPKMANAIILYNSIGIFVFYKLWLLHKYVIAHYLL